MKPSELLHFLHWIEKLKCATRHCRTSSGREESVSEHCHRLSAMALLLSMEFPTVDMDKVLRMCIVHDFGEAITGDIPAFCKTEADERRETEAVKELLAFLPETLGEEYEALFREIAEGETAEAKLFRALDKLEAIIQHNESPIGSWTELEYSENLTYGETECGAYEYLKKFRALLRSETERKIREENVVAN